MKFPLSMLFLIILITIPVKANGLEISYTKLDQNIANLDNYHGKYLLIDAMATWCGPCEISMVQLKKINEYAGEEVNLLSLSISPEYDTLKMLEDFKNDYNAEWEFGLDHNSEFIAKYNVIEIPTLFLFDIQGNLLKKWLGIVEINSKDVLNELDKYVEISGYGDSYSLSDFWGILFDESSFVIFLSGFWILTLFIVYQKFKNKKHNTLNESKA